MTNQFRNLSVSLACSTAMVISIFSPCHAEIVTRGDVTITYNSSGPSQFLGGIGITQSAFELYDRSNELIPTPPLLSSTPSSAGDPLAHAVVLGGPLRVTDLDYDSSGVTLSEIWNVGQTLSVDGRTRFDIPAAANLGEYVTFGDYNIVNEGGQLVFRDTGLGLNNIWDTANVTIDHVDSGRLAISGELLLHPDQTGFVFATAGTNVGTFTINAMTAVPEPTSVALLGIMASLVAFRRRRRVEVGGTCRVGFCPQ